MRVLVVKSQFGDNMRGHVISDPAKIDAILAGEHSVHVVVSDHPEAEKVEAAAEAQTEEVAAEEENVEAAE